MSFLSSYSSIKIVFLVLSLSLSFLLILGLRSFSSSHRFVSHIILFSLVLASSLPLLLFLFLVFLPTALVSSFSVLQAYARARAFLQEREPLNLGTIPHGEIVI